MPEPTKRRELVFHNDPVNEQVILAAALVGDVELRTRLLRHAPDTFITPEHKTLWGTIQEADRRKLGFDPATLTKLSGGEVDPAYVLSLIEGRPNVPVNLGYHVEALLWDKAKQTALTGPIASMLEALEDPKSAPEKVQGFAIQTAETFRGYQDRQYLLDPEQLIHDQLKEIRARNAGHAVYPFGLHGLDYFEASKGGQRRIMPGAAPGQITVVTGTPGSGKSTTTANLVLGLARQKRKTLWGAWEMKGGMNLELMACVSLGWSRQLMMDPQGSLTEEHFAALQERMRAISKYVRFLANPFRRRRGEKRGSNEANLDIVQGYIADSGCDIFVADLWKRCLAKADPEEEEMALIRQQAMLEELNVHGILVQQQRLKDIEQRADKKPTREGIKGSGAWTEVADTILGIHRPALWMPQEDVVLEVDILKQRYGKWPLAVEFMWHADKGLISGGTSVDYDHPISRDRLSRADSIAAPRARAAGARA